MRFSQVPIELQVHIEELQRDEVFKEFSKSDQKGIIFTGGPANVYLEDSPKCDPEIFNLGIPILGICYGMQLMTHTLGGEVKRADKREYGVMPVALRGDSKLFKGFGD